jgi:sec-independent protein translocase protein TatA
MLGDIGPLEVGIVLVVALLVFGPKRLPELGNGLGRGLREFKNSVTGEDEDKTATKELGPSNGADVERPAAEGKAPAKL